MTLLKISRLLSYILRHRPESIGIVLDSAGWADVDDLLAACAKNGKVISRAELEQTVMSDDKQRYAFSDDGRSIRASQGHSVCVDLEWPAAIPPPVLFHGTVQKFVGAIKSGGIRKMARHHVHLTDNKETALKVGGRRGEAVVLVVNSGKMVKDGHEFYLSANGVWLTDSVEARYISVLRD